MARERIAHKFFNKKLTHEYAEAIMAKLYKFILQCHDDRQKPFLSDFLVDEGLSYQQYHTMVTKFDFFAEIDEFMKFIQKETLIKKALVREYDGRFAERILEEDHSFGKKAQDAEAFSQCQQLFQAIRGAHQEKQDKNE